LKKRDVKGRKLRGRRTKREKGGKRSVPLIPILFVREKRDSRCRERRGGKEGEKECGRKPTFKTFYYFLAREGEGVTVNVSRGKKKTSQQPMSSSIRLPFSSA